MEHDYELKKFPAAPEYRNSAGRLLRLLEMLRSQNPYIETIAALYGQENATEIKGKLYIEFMQIVSSAYHEFLGDLESADAISTTSKQVMKEGLSTLGQIIYPLNIVNAPRPLQGAEVALLRVAASMLPEEGQLRKEDSDRIAESIDRLRDTVEKSDLPKSVRNALLEVIRLSRNALDQFNIYGAREHSSACSLN